MQSYHEVSWFNIIYWLTAILYCLVSQCQEVVLISHFLYYTLMNCRIYPPEVPLRGQNHCIYVIRDPSCMYSVIPRWFYCSFRDRRSQRNWRLEFLKLLWRSVWQYTAHLHQSWEICVEALVFLAVVVHWGIIFTVKCWVLIVGGSLSTLFKLCSNLLDKLDKPYAILVREHCSWLGLSYTWSPTE